MQVLELLTDVLRLALDDVDGIFDQAGDRDDHDDAVDRTLFAVFSNQREKGVPLMLVGGVGLLKGEATGRVQNDRFVGEPPVAVARATRS